MSKTILVQLPLEEAEKLLSVHLKIHQNLLVDEMQLLPRLILSLKMLRPWMVLLKRYFWLLKVSQVLHPSEVVAEWRRLKEDSHEE